MGDGLGSLSPRVRHGSLRHDIFLELRCFKNRPPWQVQGTRTSPWSRRGDPGRSLTAPQGSRLSVLRSGQGSARQGHTLAKREHQARVAVGEVSQIKTITKSTLQVHILSWQPRSPLPRLSVSTPATVPALHSSASERPSKVGRSELLEFHIFGATLRCHSRGVGAAFGTAVTSSERHGSSPDCILISSFLLIASWAPGFSLAGLSE